MITEEFYTNPSTWKEGQGIGDLFNGILSLISYKKKNNLLNTTTKITVPSVRNEIVNLFKKANCIAINEPIFTHNLHVVGIDPSRTPLRPYSLYDYFLYRDLTGNDLFDDYEFNTENLYNDITEDDVIIFPMTSGAELLNNTVFTDILNKNIKKYRKVFWNKEPHNNYRNNIPNDVNTINLSILQLLATLKTKKPRIIGQRSGMFDILFHTLPEVEMYCVYDSKDPIQMLWKLKNENEKIFLDYINKRNRFNEIFI